jgi:hypothetical protein
MASLTSATATTGGGGRGGRVVGGGEVAADDAADAGGAGEACAEQLAVAAAVVVVVRVDDAGLAQRRRDGAHRLAGALVELHPSQRPSVVASVVFSGDGDRRLSGSTAASCFCCSRGVTLSSFLIDVNCPNITCWGIELLIEDQVVGDRRLQTNPYMHILNHK